MSDKYFLIVYGYFYVICLISIIITIYDKQCAIRQTKRIKEATLFILALLGGSLAMFITMLAVRHKTRHIKFMFGIPLLITVQTLVAYYIYFHIL